MHAPVHLPATRVWIKSICSNARRQLRPVFQGKDDLTTVCCSRKRLYQRPRSQSTNFHLMKFRLFEGVFFSLCNGATIRFHQLHLTRQLVLTMASVVAIKKALEAPLVRLKKELIFLALGHSHVGTCPLSRQRFTGRQHSFIHFLYPLLLH